MEDSLSFPLSVLLSRLFYFKITYTRIQKESLGKQTASWLLKKIPQAIFLFLTACHPFQMLMYLSTSGRFPIYSRKYNKKVYILKKISFFSKKLPFETIVTSGKSPQARTNSSCVVLLLANIRCVHKTPRGMFFQSPEYKLWI